jgi:hypothetical protein
MTNTIYVRYDTIKSLPITQSNEGTPDEINSCEFLMDGLEPGIYGILLLLFF